MTITYDLYKALDLNRDLDCKQIKVEIKESQKKWTKRQSSCNDKEQLMLISKMLDAVEDGYRNLIREVKRKAYDKALDKAYNNGAIKDEIVEKLNNIFDQAKAYYNKGDIKRAHKLLVEAIENDINEPYAYRLLTGCYHESGNIQKALETVDKGIQRFPENLDLHWLGSRLTIIETENYEDAQRRINKLLELAPNNPMGHCAQIHLQLVKENEDLVFQEINQYLSNNPDDQNFRREVAYLLIAFTGSCYYVGPDGEQFIGDNSSYVKNLKYCTKAEEIYSDEYTQKKLEDAKFFGKKEWDNVNLDNIRTLTLFGFIFCALESEIGYILFIIVALLVSFSFRPKWQINKTIVTGKRGLFENIVTSIGSAATFLTIGYVKFMIWAVTSLLKLVAYIVFGRR
ncbi:MAG: hypothetical protein R3Y63_12585 [Eubacteriales bacterium]